MFIVVDQLAFYDRNVTVENAVTSYFLSTNIMLKEFCLGYTAH